MTGLKNARVLLVGGTSGIAQQIAKDLHAAGARVVLAGRDLERARTAAKAISPDVEAIRIDLQNEDSIASAAQQLTEVQHVVSLATSAAKGPVADLQRSVIGAAFDAKVIGPILLAKHFAPRMPAGGALILFSGIAAWRPAPELTVMATTNGAVAFLAEALAVEVSPIRVIAVAPGVIDSGAWDGPGKDSLFKETARTVPAQRVGQPSDISSAVQLALTNTFLTGTTLHVDGGGRLV